MKIKLNSPVSFLPDLNDEELATIRKLYKNEIFLIKDRLINVPTDGAISGHEAIRAYLQTLKKKPGSEIDVMGVLSFANSFQQLRDLLHLLERINWQNNRFAKLQALETSAIIMQNEARLLSDAVKNLFTYLGY